MSPAFILFLVWLALGLVGSRLAGDRRLAARTGLLLAAPLLVLVAYATQGWFPALLVTLSVPTIYAPELRLLARLSRALLAQRRGAPRGTRPAPPLQSPLQSPGMAAPLDPGPALRHPGA